MEPASNLNSQMRRAESRSHRFQLCLGAELDQPPSVCSHIRRLPLLYTVISRHSVEFAGGAGIVGRLASESHADYLGHFAHLLGKQSSRSESCDRVTSEVLPGCPGAQCSACVGAEMLGGGHGRPRDASRVQQWMIPTLSPPSAPKPATDSSGRSRVCGAQFHFKRCFGVLARAWTRALGSWGAHRHLKRR
jgi:hypothetical protein